MGRGAKEGAAHEAEDLFHIRISLRGVCVAALEFPSHSLLGRWWLGRGTEQAGGGDSSACAFFFQGGVMVWLDGAWGS